MAKQTRAAARKMKDKWKAKGWYTLHAPPMFDAMPLGETPADDAAKLHDRVAEVTVQDLTGDFSKMHIKLRFRVQDVRGHDAFTQFVGHDMTSDYIRRLTRRKRTRTDAVLDVRTKDGWVLRLKPMAITDRRIQASKQKAIRAIMLDVARDAATKASVGELVRAIISGELAKRIAVACKPIQPTSRVEVRKSQVLAFPPGGEPLAEPKEEAEEAEAPEPEAVEAAPTEEEGEGEAEAEPPAPPAEEAEPSEAMPEAGEPPEEEEPAAPDAG
jgi:small subunit ribosomal protein S3Ae